MSLQKGTRVKLSSFLLTVYTRVKDDPRISRPQHWVGRSRY
jgi:hypothetical protein